jgi:hypothetical protein
VRSRVAEAPEQLTLDLFVADRTRSGKWPVEAHQRGYVRMPYTTAGGVKVGTIVPAWVCCRCGGVDLNAFLLSLNHGCCTSYVPTCALLRPTEGTRRFGAHWMPERPAVRGATGAIASA